VVVDSNPTTGYKWVVKQDYDMECLKQLGEGQTTTSEGRPRVGAGGTTMLKFEAIGSGCSGEVKLAYVRPWALDWSNVPAQDLKTLKVAVMGPPKEVVDPNLMVVELLQDADVTKEDNVFKVKIPAGKNLGLKFASNPTTGAKWMVDEYEQTCIEKPDILYRMRDEGYPLVGAPQLMGVGGQSTLVFKPVAGSAGCT